MADHEALITEFTSATGVTGQAAQGYLEAYNWNLDDAVTAYFEDGEEEPEAEPTAPTARPTVVPAYTGPRTLDGRPAPQYAGASSSSTAKKPQKRTGLATLSSLGGGHSHDDDDEDDEDYDDDDEQNRPRDLFAGGEKSGLAVQDPSQRSNDPRKLISDIVAKAKAARKSASEQSGSPGPSRFRGGGQTLGGDGVESRRIVDPNASPIPAAVSDGPAQERVLHIWNDGFSIDDGELRRLDDPQNQADLQMIRQGTAPLHLMNVRFDQRVDVKLQQHQENYRPLPKVYRPFGGSGHRLGSPVPGDGSVAPPPPTTATTSTAPATGSANTTTPDVDTSQPTLMLRIQLPDGTRLPARFNTSQTVGDVYAFVRRASPAIGTREWVLSTTFPSKDHADKDLVLGEMAEFKRGGTAVVKWA